MSQAEFNSWVEPKFYTDINNVVLRIMTSHRSLVAQEKLAQEIFGGPNQQKIGTYKDFAFQKEGLEFYLEEPNLDLWIKESIMLFMKSVVQFLKQQSH